MHWWLLGILGFGTLFNPRCLIAESSPVIEVPALKEAGVVSSIDGKRQKVRYWHPESPGPHPILVSLHSWSGDYTQDHSLWLREAVDRGWVFIEPDFRGINDHPEACGSPFARQDVIDALDWGMRTHQIDAERVYLAGISGGGHMTMLMAAYSPDRFSAASAWVGISDLRDWHAFHSKPEGKDNYALMTEKCCGGAPGQSAAVDVEYFQRSPIHFLHHAADVPLDLNAGITDGKTGSVKIQHSLQAFNVIARARKTPEITPAEIEQLWMNGRLSNPQAADTATDENYGRELFLRRTSGPSRITLFDGGHEGLAPPACAWLSQQRRATQPPK